MKIRTINNCIAVKIKIIVILEEYYTEPFVFGVPEDVKMGQLYRSKTTPENRSWFVNYGDDDV